jgi:hypothetical protein
MKEFLMLYAVEIISIIVIILALGALWYLRKIPLVKKILYALVCEAEQKFGSGTGDIKYAMVISAFYYKMPFLLRLTFSQELLSKLIEEAVDKLKCELSNGMDLTGYSPINPIITLTMPGQIPIETVMENTEEGE